MIGFCDPNHILRRTELLRYPSFEGLFALPVMHRLLLLFVFFPVLTGAFDKTGLYSGVGAITCPDYVKNFDEGRAERPSPDHIRVDRLFTQGWLLGYLSAYNAWTENDRKHIADGLDVAEIESWVAEYCREHSLETIADAMLALIPVLESDSF